MLIPLQAEKPHRASLLLDLLDQQSAMLGDDTVTVICMRSCPIPMTNTVSAAAHSCMRQVCQVLIGITHVTQSFIQARRCRVSLGFANAAEACRVCGSNDINSSCTLVRRLCVCDTCAHRYCLVLGWLLLLCLPCLILIAPTYRVRQGIFVVSVQFLPHLLLALYAVVSSATQGTHG